jgi:predicted DNA-binding WGR domain protein
VTQPGILRAFGWQVALVLTRDWYHEPQGVLDRIERLIRGEAEPVVELEDDLPLPAPQSDVPSAPAKATAAHPASAVGTDESARRLELIEGNSSKYWEISQDACAITVRYGRIGAQGQAQTKVFDTPERAAREAKKLTAEKLRKGYRDA